MKLKKGFILHDVAGEHMAVATGKAAKSFNGIIRNNDTANFIYKMLLNDTAEDEIVEKMLKEYDAPKHQIAADVHEIIEKLRELDLLEE